MRPTDCTSPGLRLRASPERPAPRRGPAGGEARALLQAREQRPGVQTGHTARGLWASRPPVFKAAALPGAACTAPTVRSCSLRAHTRPHAPSARPKTPAVCRVAGTAGRRVSSSRGTDMHTHRHREAYRHRPAVSSAHWPGRQERPHATRWRPVWPLCGPRAFADPLSGLPRHCPGPRVLQGRTGLPPRSAALGSWMQSTSSVNASSMGCCRANAAPAVARPTLPRLRILGLTLIRPCVRAPAVPSPVHPVRAFARRLPTIPSLPVQAHKHATKTLARTVQAQIYAPLRLGATRPGPAAGRSPR